MRRMLVLLYAVAGCGVQRDLDRACEMAAEVAARQDVPPELRPGVLGLRVEEEIGSIEVRRVFAALARASRDQRLALWRKGIEELGAPDYRCPALEQLWADAG
jgi:hypothetical protein